ncbi:PucR family transcriptional regulator [Jiangella endophytica]|uniref:PucR family transcriptional regulator n=1 Tax=Jiangella endophytica TaxID=1623398 RepID=UPI00130023CD|nr:helix-turn-helix domain-containing protein [Jiangella endophytica]
MAAELQRLVDSLGSQMRRSVAVDDQYIRLLAYTSHTRDVDTARIGSILRRSVPAELKDYIAMQGAAQAADLFTLPANPAVGLEVARIGVPVRFEQKLLGYLWLLASDGEVSPHDAEVLREAADEAARILHREHVAGELAGDRERGLVRNLLSTDHALREEAAQTLVEEEWVVVGPVTVLVATLSHARDEPIGERGRLALRIAIDHGRRRLPPGHGLVLHRPDHSVLVAAWPEGRAVNVDYLAGEVHGRLMTEAAPADGRGWVGSSTTQRFLADAHTGYLEARRAAEVARITGALGPTVSYARLGVFAMLAKLPPDELADSIHPGMRRLLNSVDHRELVETLTAYFDNAADVKRTASQLHIHRATLYQRLRRAEDVTGLKLSHGDDRLAAHLGLKLAQLVP